MEQSDTEVHDQTQVGQIGRRPVQAPSLRLWVAEARRRCSPTATAREGGRVPRVVSPTVGVRKAGHAKPARDVLRRLRRKQGLPR